MHKRNDRFMCLIMYVFHYLFTLSRYGKSIKHLWQVGNNSSIHKKYCFVVMWLHSSLNKEKPEVNIQGDFTAIPLCSCSNILTDKLLFPLATIIVKGSCWTSITLNPHFMDKHKKRLTESQWSAALTAPSSASSSSDFQNHLDNIYPRIKNILKPKNPILCGYHVKKQK